MENHIFIDTPVGKIGIAADDAAITRVFFSDGSSPGGSREMKTPLLDRAALQLREYFDGRRREFDLPLSPRGTEFQRKVWDALTKIPHGQTRTYGQIAASVGNPKASRAVGGANNRNPIAIVIPCHRVVGANGSMVGYAFGTEIKERLLELEKAGRTATAAV